jgi:aldehyde dehydrogenase (NAD+)
MKNYPDPAFLNGSVRLLLIDGKWVAALSGKVFITINPTDGAALAQVADGGPEDIDLAVAAARRAFESGPWRRMKPFDRQQCLLRLADLVDAHFDELALLDTLDMGAPVASIAGKRRRAVALLRYYAGLATAVHGQTIENSQPGDIFSHTVKEPVGVVGAINAWNGPLGMAIWKTAPALAAGCTIVLKPAEQAPLSPLRFGELCLEAGIPPGVVNVVSGGAAAGAALAAHPDVDKVAFTGSTEVGRRIIHASAGNIKRVSLELGGKSPNIVFADADMDLAVPGAAMAVFANSGQICSAGTRLFVQRDIYNEFVDKLCAFAKSLRVGNPRLEDTQLGPLVSQAQLDRVETYLKLGSDQGAELVAGGSRLTSSGLSNGYFVAPTVFAGVRDDMAIATDEIFGPVISVMPFDTVEEAIARGNATPYGLGSGVWTRDINNAHKVSRGLRAGSVWINCYQAMDAAVPFGGYKGSGYGRESGIEHMEEFLHTKSVWTRVT